MGNLLFSCFAALVVASAVGVVAFRNAVNAAMSLLLCLVGVAALFVRLDAYLLAFLFLLVYAGAVVALFLFIIMLLDIQGITPARKSGRARVGGAISFLLLGAGLVGLSFKGRLVAPSAASVPPLGASLRLYADELFTTYLLPVEIVGFLLLIAMLGVIALSRGAAGRAKTAGGGA
jgi:NADH-quinone oxidoreductase subunit J